MTEEQKDCHYCHFDRHGRDFTDGDDYRFRLAKDASGYYIHARSELAFEAFDVDSEYIRYCPMCGRKLKED